MSDQLDAINRAVTGFVSPDFDAYCAGETDYLRCVLCMHAPCDCPPFGSDEYLAMVNRLHGKGGAR